MYKYKSKIFIKHMLYSTYANWDWNCDIFSRENDINQCQNILVFYWIIQINEWHKKISVLYPICTWLMLLGWSKSRWCLHITFLNENIKGLGTASGAPLISVSVAGPAVLGGAALFPITLGHRKTAQDDFKKKVYTFPAPTLCHMYQMQTMTTICLSVGYSFSSPLYHGKRLAWWSML